MKSSRTSFSLAAACWQGSIGNAFAAGDRRAAPPRPARPCRRSLVPVTQAMLDAAEGDKSHWLHSNMAYSNSRYYPADQINTGNVAQAAARVHLPDRSDGVDGDLADRRQRRDVPHDLLQPRLRDRRDDRQGVLALQAQDGAGHHLLLRPEQPRRGDLPTTCSTWARSTPSWWRSTRRPARCCGRPRSPIPRRATPKPWLRSWWTARC